MTKFILILLGVLVLARVALAQQEYNPVTGQWESVPDHYRPSYGGHQNESSLQDPSVQTFSQPQEDLQDQQRSIDDYTSEPEGDGQDQQELQRGSLSEPEGDGQDQQELRRDSLSEPEEIRDGRRRPPWGKIPPYRPTRRR
jgi:hypothetical protein